MTYVSEVRSVVGHRPLLLAAAGAGRWLLQRRVDDGRWGLIGGALKHPPVLSGYNKLLATRARASLARLAG